MIINSKILSINIMVVKKTNEFIEVGSLRELGDLL